MANDESRIEVKSELKKIFKIEGTQPISIELLKSWVETLPNDANFVVYHYPGNATDPGYTTITVVQEL